jgi:cytochrome P450
MYVLFINRFKCYGLTGSKQCKELISSLARAPADSKEVTSSMFRTALNPNREKGQYVATSDELAADAVLVFLAGTDTTAHALTIGIWEMAKKPELWKRLREEVALYLPESESLAAVRDLETLPFLVGGTAKGSDPWTNDALKRGVIKESLRFSLGTSARLHRVVPPQGAVLCGEGIAPGVSPLPLPMITIACRLTAAQTRVSFSHYVYNNDPAIFPDPHSFKPERWLEANVEELERHMVSFSRGSRNCIGMKYVPRSMTCKVHNDSDPL